MRLNKLPAVLVVFLESEEFKKHVLPHGNDHLLLEPELNDWLWLLENRVEEDDGLPFVSSWTKLPFTGNWTLSPSL